MDIPREKRWLCVVCGTGRQIVERCIEHTFEGEPPDQSNCDLSTYGEISVEGGRLLADRPMQYWHLDYRNADAIPAGGVCDACLSLDLIKKLVPHIRFA